MARIELHNITNYSCKNINLVLEDGKITVFIGKTGAGKTTLLNVVAGIVPYEGSVCFDGEAMDRISPSKREVGYLFQSFALFPNLRVSENILFGLKIRGVDERTMKQKLCSMAEMLGIEHILERYPKGLSGGEKQRVAFARALIFEPKILILDEPFSNLDPRTAAILRSEIKHIQRHFQITTLFVTHNQKEAFELADTIVVLNDGRIEQIEKPQKLLFAPANDAVNALLGYPTVLQCEEKTILDYGLIKIKSGTFSLIVASEKNDFSHIAILTRDIRFSKFAFEDSMSNKYEAYIVKIEQCNVFFKITLEVENVLFCVELSKVNWEHLGAKINEKLFIAIPFSAIKVL